MGASAAVAIMIAKQKHIVRAFREAGATAVETAVDPATINVHHRGAFRILQRHDIVREAGTGRFYLDEVRWEQHQQFRRRLASILIVAVVAAFLVVYFVAR